MSFDFKDLTEAVTKIPETFMRDLPSIVWYGFSSFMTVKAHAIADENGYGRSGLAFNAVNGVMETLNQDYMISYLGLDSGKVGSVSALSK